MAHRFDNQGGRWTNEKGVAQAALTSQSEPMRRGYRIGNEQRLGGTTVKKGEQRGERKPKTEEGTMGRGEEGGREVDGQRWIGRVAVEGDVWGETDKWNRDNNKLSMGWGKGIDGVTKGKEGRKGGAAKEGATHNKRGKEQIEFNELNRMLFGSTRPLVSMQLGSTRPAGST